MTIFRRKFLSSFTLAATGIWALSGTTAKASSRYYYVSTNGSDTNIGDKNAPFLTIQKGVDVAQPGDKVVVYGGIYRDQSVVFPRDGASNAPITLIVSQGAQATLKGSRLFTDSWTLESGSVYVRSWTLYFPASESGQKDARSLPRNQLFVNGVYYQETYNRSDVFAGSFYIDSEQDLVYVWLADSSSPNGKNVEVTSQEQLLTTNGKSWITIKGLGFEHCANKGQEYGAVRLKEGSNCKIEKCSVRYASGAGLNVKSGTNNSVLQCKLNNNGQQGLSSSSTTNMRVERTEMSSNNRLPGKQFSTGFEAGGCKITRSRNAVFKGVIAYNNYGSGIWFDADNRDATIEQCRCYENQIGIHYEISYTALIKNNLCYNNKLQSGSADGPYGLGINISSSAGCRIYNNTTCGNDNAGIQVYGPSRNDGTGQQVYSYANDARNNLVSDNARANKYGIRYYSDNLYLPEVNNSLVPYSPNTSNFNLFWESNSLSGKFFKNPQADDLEEWQFDSLGKDINSLWSEPLFVNLSASDFHLQATSPATDAGTSLEAVAVDFDSVARPQGSGYSIGAFEG